MIPFFQGSFTKLLKLAAIKQLRADCGSLGSEVLSELGPLSFMILALQGKTKFPVSRSFIYLRIVSPQIAKC